MQKQGKQIIQAMLDLIYENQSKESSESRIALINESVCVCFFATDCFA